jgi:DNA adenine methylase
MPQQRGILQSSQNIDAYKHVPRSYPFVKWAGGKSQIMSELDSLIPSEFDRYFEPFLGGGAMFFHLFSKNIQFTSHLSDTNEDLINAYRVVKDDVEVLIRLLKHHEKEYENSHHKYYYQLRAKINPLTDVERAARFITLNKTCYNGLYRVNSKGLFNVPMGRYKNPVIVHESNNKNTST